MSGFVLREMQAADSRALTALMEEMSENQGLGMTTYYQIDAYQALTAVSGWKTLGVVAEVEDFDELAGIGTVSFGECQFEGVLRPFAYLANLKVHPRFRQQGLGTRLAQWRIDRAREHAGSDGVIWTGMQRDNEGSRRTASKWSREFFEPMIVAVVPIRSRPPRLSKDVVVHPAVPADLSEIAEKQNAFYHDFNLYPPQTADTLRDWLERSPVDRPVNHYFVAVDSAGEIIAGAGVTEGRQVLLDQLHNLPLPLRVLNRIVHIVPPDYVIQHLPVSKLWYSPGQPAAAQQVWETIRWECRTLGTTVSSVYDPRGPLRDVFQLKPWHQPRIELAFAVHGPVPMTQTRFIYVSGR
jgi:GNAT superfamily N-acetyltransferase